MESELLHEAVTATRGMFFDFDGPVCDVFSGLPASEVVRALADVMQRFHSDLSEKMREMDFMDALRVSPQGGEDALVAVEATLVAAEMEAVGLAGDPTPGAVAALKAAATSGRSVAIVSNNSAECVREFLARHELAPLVDEVVGRPGHQPHLMKPSPYSLYRAAELLEVSPRSCALVGDSVSDVAAAIAAAARSIGYANRPGKALALAEAGADAVIDDMATLADALTRTPVS
ncbi:HAD family hydrolase [Streptomyces sp. NPDC051597]|uniref:HAD family hydrolase n=1 Tax=Streptomyces sp. NPDC051597 TaxID=3155049 RepID=UPI0034270A27